MNKRLISLVAAGIVAMSISGAIAPRAGAAPVKAKPAAAQKLPDVKYPYTFVCKHCGIKITVKSAADWSKKCPACPCGTSVLECLPDQKKK